MAEKRFLQPLPALALLLTSLAGCHSDVDNPEGPESVTELNFGMISTESTIGLQRGFQPFIDDMSKALGMPVNSYFATDYAGMIEAMRFEKVDVAWLGNKSAIEAVDRAGGEVFAQTSASDGTPGYLSVIVVHQDSPYRTIDEVIANGNKLTFGNGDPHSTSGYLMPAYHLWAKRNIDPKTHFRRVINSNHEANGLAVALGQIDLATNHTDWLAQFMREKPELAAKLRIVWKSPVIPDDPLVWRKQLPEELKQRIRSFVLSYGSSGPDAKRQLAVLSKMSTGWAPFRASSNDQLIPIRELMVAEKIKDLEATTTLSAAQKRVKLAELRSELERLRDLRTKLERSPLNQSDNSFP